MLKSNYVSVERLLLPMAGLLVLKVTVSVMLAYRDYFPPNFGSDFLHGRQSYFWGPYRWAFYTHIASGPASLILGLTLVSDRFRLRFPKWHRLLGKLQVAVVLLLLVPSGTWMAYYARAGTIATSAFFALAAATGLCVAMGWRSAVQRRFAEHRRWMWRCFLLLCAAVILRLIVGLATVTGVSGDWTDPLAAWVSWLAPLAAFESGRALGRLRRRLAVAGSQSGSRSVIASSPAMEISARRVAAGKLPAEKVTRPSTNAAFQPPG